MAKDKRPDVPDHLLQLQRVANAARADALREDYSPEAWRPWWEAAAAVHAAVTEHAAAAGVNRSDLEMAVKAAAAEAVAAGG
ncbi:hypothetical protein [Streptomyces sp. NRRL F-5135]|uniref:hypothetical protein n=1 Tax=Streptomyces sp. NRRL F-5135 TaxID=1463858 RepID=UPI0004CC72B3|nr:hypothetical protein [Streptomyces sp. NRRL F-5135]